MTLNPHLKRLLDFLPLAVFFLGYKFLGLFPATALLLIFTLFVLGFTYAVERKVALSPLITAIMVMVFGGLTLVLHDEKFIKMKPTLIYLIFAIILLIGCALRKNPLKPMFGDVLQLTERGWRGLSIRWGCFFIGLAGLNEYIWRHFSTDAWVNFKVFGCVGLIFIFFILQAGFIERHALPSQESPPVKN